MRSKGEPSLSDAEKQGEDDSTATVQDATKVCMFFFDWVKVGDQNELHFLGCHRGNSTG